MAALLGCIADDFTGGTDLAGLLVKAGVEQPFVSAQLDSILRSDSQPFVAAEVKRLRAALKPA